jgi:hypothetical protein
MTIHHYTETATPDATRQVAALCSSILSHGCKAAQAAIGGLVGLVRSGLRPARLRDLYRRHGPTGRLCSLAFPRAALCAALTSYGARSPQRAALQKGR